MFQEPSCLTTQKKKSLWAPSLHPPATTGMDTAVDTEVDAEEVEDAGDVVEGWDWLARFEQLTDVAESVQQ